MFFFSMRTQLKVEDLFGSLTSKSVYGSKFNDVVEFGNSQFKNFSYFFL